MSNFSATPVILIVFNRPETTARVMERLAQMRPTRLLVVADGPRSGKIGEEEKCAATREITEKIDWDCDVSRNYAGENMGCKARVVSGLNWAFEHVENAMILEDDCLPDPTFFSYCTELLERFENDESIMHVSGSNLQMGKTPTQKSYYFSRYPMVWGWATWRRAWNLFDDDMSFWNENGRDWLMEFLETPRARQYWTHEFDALAAGKINTWDYHWLYSCWRRNGLSVTPAVNLVSNIGFGMDATHTSAGSALAGLPTSPMTFPLRHPDTISRDVLADAFTQRRHYSLPRWGLFKDGVRRLLPGGLRAQIRRVRAAVLPPPRPGAS